MRLSNSIKLVVIGAALLFAGCGVMSGFYRQRPMRFNHRIHLEKAGLACEVCHSGLSEDKEPGMPDINDCRTCHGADEDETSKIKPFLKDGKANWTNVTDLSEDVKFAHVGHLKVGLKCADCHKGIEKSVAVSDHLRLDMDRCMDCHSDAHQSVDCATCHQKISKQWPPSSHQRNWPRMHGKNARQGSDALVDRCTLCHSETWCTNCHKDTKPQDHINLWRLKTHGANAAMDRERCMACHRTDFCRDCHTTTQPFTHTAAWKPPTALHCQQCHFPLEETNCFVCHKEAHVASGGAGGGGAPPPVNAPPLPNNNLHRTVSETQCLNCHNLPGGHPAVTGGCRNCHR